ncbi:MAG: Arylsulfatase [Verrucomicrobia subdivision 3 bacterium]|nr:Arylsulfatase [Limisphaerales bacterium]MCS1416538.1 Arylsulfatase [Limisphaerales bacterium]
MVLKSMRNNCSILAGLCFALAALSLTAKQPNVVLVITDDQGYGDLSCHGNPVLKTPHLDRLHSESVRLTDYHVAPTCAPTRSALLTGHWTNRTGVWHTIMGRSMLRANEITLGNILGDAGYATGMFGKWHLGDNYPYRPEDRGFQEVLRHGGGGVGQTPDYWDNAYFDGSYWHNGILEPAKGFCTDVFFDYAIDFIDSKKDSGQPFFVYLCTNAPHGPMHAPEKSSEPYQHLGTQLANFYGMIANIDDNVGRLRRHLQENGLAEDTIFIFTTDNGTSSGDKIFNNGMRGKKGSEYDGGHRVPFFIHWPKGGLVDGRDVSMITSYVDIVPTLIELCEVPSPKGVKFDGVSIRALLFGREASDWPDRILVTDSQRVRDPIKWRKSSVMTDQYRLINGKELYDVRVDPGQRKNIASKNADVVARLREFYEEWWAELEPTFSQTTEIYLGHPKARDVRLTCHDWIADGSTPWNQRHIRNAERRPNNTGFWAVKVIEPGDYEVELRRWPREVNHPITASLSAGENVPGVQAFRAVPGKAFPAVSASLVLGGQALEKAVHTGDTAVTFRLPLRPGKDELWAKFKDAEGNEMGAFYAYVRKAQDE